MKKLELRRLRPPHDIELRRKQMEKMAKALPHQYVAYVATEIKLNGTICFGNSGRRGSEFFPQDFAL
jgi:hypothetical protein